VLGFWIGIVGPTDTPTRAALMAAAWLINLLVAEYLIHRRTGALRVSRTSGRSGTA
jgi:hypothetical protein